MMLKVLEITVSAAYGGGPQHVYELVSHLGDGVLVDIASPRQEPYWDRFSTVIQGEMVEIPERSFTFTAALRLVKHVRRRKISLLHSHGKGAGVYGRIVAALTGVPLVHTPHGIHLDHYGWFMQGVYVVYERLTGRIADRTIFVSKSEKARATALALWPSVPSRVISNGVRSWPEKVSHQWRRELRQSMGIGDEEVVIVTLSRFDYPKNMMEMATIAAHMSDVRFWFIGDGADKQEVEEFCSKQELNNVWFPGFVPDPIRYLAAADVYLSTSRWEGLPLSLLEAMALAKPVVASEVTGNCDAVHDNVTGYLYPLGATEQAVELLSCLVNDRRMRNKMGQGSQQFQKSAFSVEAMAEKTLAVYKEILTII